MPYLSDGRREYRSAEHAFRAEPSGYVVEGYATTFDAPYDFGGTGAKEQVSSRALDDADMSDVIFQMNHEGMVLARLRNGTLSLTPDEHGLRVRADLSGSAQGRELYEAVKNGLIDRMSWGFSVADGGWEWDEESRTSTVTRVTKVYDVSAVSLPADEDTELHARSYLDGVIEAERRESAGRDRERRRRMAMALTITKREESEWLSRD